MTTRWFWHTLIVPLLEALRPAVIVEVGAEDGLVSAPLVEWAHAHGAVAHVIDPKPKFDHRALADAHDGSLRFHEGRSLRVLPHIACADLVLLDGDHNWYTVINELRQIERRAERGGRLPPVVLLHDVEWPYARRDLYYDPSSIPARHRHPHARSGMVRGQSKLVRGGLNRQYHNARHEGGPANGVLTAVEDFIAESPTAWRFTIVPGLYGLGILAPKELLRRRRAVRRVIDSTDTPEFLRAQCHAIEEARTAATIRGAR